jgi:transposase
MTENKNAVRARYTLEFKREAGRLVESGQSMAAAARKIGIAEQTLFHWVKAQREGRLSGIASSRSLSAEQREISRLRAELAHVKMERDILGKATAYFAQGLQ